MDIEILKFYFQRIRHSKWFRSPGESIGLKFIPSQSELFLFIPISVSEPMRIIPNQSEKLFVSCLMKNSQKSIRLNSIHSGNSMRMNPNQSETKFLIRIIPNNSDLGFIRIDSDWKFSLDQSDLNWVNNPNEPEPIRHQVFNPNQTDLGLIQTELSIRINPNESEVGMIRIDLDWKLGFGLVWTYSHWFLGINRIKSHWFLTVFHQTRYITFIGLVRNDSHWLGYRYRNESE